MKITKIDADKNKTVIARNLAGMADVLNTLHPILDKRLVEIPNNPKLDRVSLDEVGIFIGVYRVESYLVEND